MHLLSTVLKKNPNNTGEEILLKGIFKRLLNNLGGSLLPQTTEKTAR